MGEAVILLWCGFVLGYVAALGQLRAWTVLRWLWLLDVEPEGDTETSSCGVSP